MAIAFLNNGSRKDDKMLVGLISRSLDEIKIPNGVESIGDSAFAGYEGLKKVQFSKNVKSIGSKSFSGCSTCELFDFSNMDSAPELKNVDAFEETSLGSKFLIPYSLKNSWCENDSWNSYEGRIITTKAPYDITEYGQENLYFDARAIWEKSKNLSMVSKVSYETECNVPFVRYYGNGLSGEAYFNMYSNGSNTTVPAGRYFIVAYRIPTTNKENAGAFECYTSTSTASVKSTSRFTFYPIKDGKWHVDVIDTQVAMGMNLNGAASSHTYLPSDDGKYYMKHLRFDVINQKFSTESYLDLAYIGFTNDYTLVKFIDPDFDTLTYSPAFLKDKIGTNANLSVDLDHSNMPYVAVNYKAGSTENTVTLHQSTDGYGVISNTGKYVGILYRTSHTNEIDLYVQNVTINSTYDYKQTILCDNDGEWHYEIIELNTANQYITESVAKQIRLDYFNNISTGNPQIDIGFLKFFHTEEEAQEYYQNNYVDRYGLPGLHNNTSLAYTLNDDGASYSVTGIGTCEDTNIVIPSEYEGLPVTSIGEYAFSECSSLTNITIPNSVTSIGDRAFFRCTSLASITMPNNVTSIGERAFVTCANLTSITIPDSVTSIGDYAFYNCSSLKEVHISDITKWCNISFGDSLANPLEYARNLYLNGELVTDLVVPDSVTSIGDYAFYGCSSLTSITIPNSVTSIGQRAFSGCPSLTSIVIPNGVTSIGSNAFYNCSSLESITIPDSVTSIASGMFDKCSSLSSVIIPDGVTSIDDRAFRGCSSLTSITIPNSVTSIGNSAFEDCSSLTSITIPDSVTSIGYFAFKNCASLTSITIPNSVTSIYSSAFDGCNALNTYDFSDCTSIPTLTQGTLSTLSGAEGFQIIIPANLYEEWIAAENWSSYADHFVSAYSVTNNVPVMEGTYENNIPNYAISGKPLSFYFRDLTVDFNLGVHHIKVYMNGEDITASVIVEETLTNANVEVYIPKVTGDIVVEHTFDTNCYLYDGNNVLLTFKYGDTYAENPDSTNYFSEWVYIAPGGYDNDSGLFGGSGFDNDGDGINDERTIHLNYNTMEPITCDQYIQ